MSAKKQLVVVDANAYWTEQLFRTFAPDWDVLLVKPRAIRTYLRQHPSQRLGHLLESAVPGLRILHLPMPPRYTTWLWPIGRALLSRAIVRAGGASPDVLVICFPEYRDLFDSLTPRMKLYYNYDDYTAHWPGRAEALVSAEDATIARADLSIFIAKYRVDHLAMRLPDCADKLHHLPIGVTPSFTTEFGGPRLEPQVLRTIPRPRAGYIGVLSYRFDFPFFAESAARLRDVQFVLGGALPKKTQGDKVWWAGVEIARSLPNVHFIGWVDHDTLGDHLAHFDVLLMPYSRCAFNDSACPAKLWDYMGTGLPIVANANNPETLRWSDVVVIGDTPSLFAAHIEAILCNSLDKLSEKRLSIAREHTWVKLGQRLRERIEATSLV